jgi:tetratricopeptide (TPR) repeat protein
MSRNLAETKNKALAHALNDAIGLRAEGRPREALVLLDSHAAEFERGDDLYRAKYHNGRALSLKALKQYNEAFREFELAKHFYGLAGDIPRVGLSESNISNLYLQNSNTRLAKDHLFNAISIFQTYKETVFLSQAHENLARIFYIEGDYRQSARAAWLAYNALLDEAYEVIAPRAREEARKTLDCALDAVDGLTTQDIQRTRERNVWERLLAWLHLKRV